MGLLCVQCQPCRLPLSCGTRLSNHEKNDRSFRFMKNTKYVCTRTCNWHRDHRRGCSNNIIMILPGVDCLRERSLAELCLQLFALLQDFFLKLFYWINRGIYVHIYTTVRRRHFFLQKLLTFFTMKTALKTLIILNNTFCSVSQVFAEWIRNLKKKLKTFIMCT